jgi:hypothetical protein
MPRRAAGGCFSSRAMDARMRTASCVRNMRASRQTLPFCSRMPLTLHQPCARTVGPVLSGHWCCVNEKPSPFPRWRLFVAFEPMGYPARWNNPLWQMRIDSACIDGQALIEFDPSKLLGFHFRSKRSGLQRTPPSGCHLPFPDFESNVPGMHLSSRIAHRDRPLRRIH